MLEDAESSTLFAWRIVLVFESNIPSKSQFSRWRKAHFFQIGLSTDWKKRMHHSTENHLCKKLQHQAHSSL
jgi:hypothetical protein